MELPKYEPTERLVRAWDPRSDEALYRAERWALEAEDLMSSTNEGDPDEICAHAAAAIAQAWTQIAAVLRSKEA